MYYFNSTPMMTSAWFDKYPHIRHVVLHPDGTTEVSRHGYVPVCGFTNESVRDQHLACYMEGMIPFRVWEKSNGNHKQR